MLYCPCLFPFSFKEPHRSPACHVASLLPLPLTNNNLFALEKCIIGPFQRVISTLLNQISDTCRGPTQKPKADVGGSRLHLTLAHKLRNNKSELQTYSALNALDHLKIRSIASNFSECSALLDILCTLFMIWLTSFLTLPVTNITEIRISDRSFHRLWIHAGIVQGHYFS